MRIALVAHLGNSMKIAVTGANGYLGRNLIKFFEEQRIECVGLVRKPSRENELEFILGELPQKKLLEDIDILIHTAYDFDQKTIDKNLQININGTKSLFEIAQQNRVKKIVFISSMSSFNGVKSIYGRTKFACEKIAADYGAYIIRPGLIYSEEPSGIVGKLSQLAQLPVIPYITIKSPLYMCHIEDLTQLINAVINNDITAETPIIAANNSPYSLKDILKKLGAKIMFPIPWQLIWVLLKTIEKCGLHPRTGSDNLVSLVNQNPKPDFQTLNLIINCNFRNF